MTATARHSRLATQSLPHTADTLSGPSHHDRAPCRKLIAAGDLVIVFTSRDKAPLPITITPGHEFGNAYGTFPHDDIVGLPFGSKIASRNRRGFVHLLRPNPELWTLALPHRTQIVYTPDMSFIAAHLGLSPGAKVIEAGTGSGSFSHYLTRIVARKHEQSSGFGWKGKRIEGRASLQRNGRVKLSRDSADGEGAAEESEDEQVKKEPLDQEEAEILERLGQNPDQICDVKEGRVWSFEFHAGRAIKAWKEFQDHGLFQTLSLRHRNVCKLGFGLKSVADAVFLDLPAPWEALDYAVIALRSDVACRICCFSPCVEQVLRTVEAMRRGGNADEEEARWVDIETYECLSRTHKGVWVGTGGQTSNAPIDEAILRIRQVEEKKVKRREAQIERVKRERLAKAEALQEEENKGETREVSSIQEVDGSTAERETIETGGKRKREDDNQAKEDNIKRNEKTRVDDTTATHRAMTKDGRIMQLANIYARTFPEMKGHTSYLTFATLLPRNVKQDLTDATGIKKDEHLHPDGVDWNQAT